MDIFALCRRKLGLNVREVDGVFMGDEVAHELEVIERVSQRSTVSE